MKKNFDKENLKNTNVTNNFFVIFLYIYTNGE